jgi:hypothetical protein
MNIDKATKEQRERKDVHFLCVLRVLLRRNSPALLFDLAAGSAKFLPVNRNLNLSLLLNALLLRRAAVGF